MKYNVPILLICFKRYEKTLALFEVVKTINPRRVYVAIDGPRNDAERAEVEKVASIFEGDNFDFEINVRKSDTNQGCKYSVYNAINWFFEHEEEGIILEDDILPFPHFFPYCEELLNKYRDDKRIACISGWGYFYNKEPENYPYSYYFSHIQSSWGWATWKDRWQLIDLEMENTKFEDIERNLKNDDLPPSIINFYKRIYYGKIAFDSTWDYQFLLSVLMKYNMYAIQPIRRFVKNVGTVDGTHPTNEDHNKSKMFDADFKMVHPEKFFYDPSIDILRNYQTNECIR